MPFSNARRVSAALAAAVILLFLSLSALPVGAAGEREAPYVTLSLYAYGSSAVGSSGTIGHSFITIQNLQAETIGFCGYPIAPGRTISVSIFGDLYGLGGVYINREMAGARNSVGAYCAALSQQISESTYREIERMTPGESYYHDGTAEGSALSEKHDILWHNCTTYSVGVWNRAMELELDLHTASTAPPEPHDSRWSGWNVDDDGVRYITIPDGFQGIDHPKWVKEEIQRWGGHWEGEFTHEEPWGPGDVFYLTKDGNLVPDCPAVPRITSIGTDRGRATLFWEAEGIDRPEMQKCDILYEIRSTPWEQYAAAVKAINDAKADGAQAESVWNAFDATKLVVWSKHGPVRGSSCTLDGLGPQKTIFSVRMVCRSYDGVYETVSDWSDLAEAEFAAPPSAAALSEQELRAIADQKGAVGLWGWADYDGDGAGEAFAVTVTGWNDIEAVWFISATGEAACVADNIAGACYAMDMEDAQCVLDCGGQKVFWADYGAYGSGWQTLLFSVRSAAPYELELSRAIQGIAQENGGFSTTENDFSTGTHLYLSVPLHFNAARGEFERS